jgi:cbb3-type cytochrome oxidase maturation protein
LNIDMLFYMIGALSIAGITAYLFMWSILSEQYREDEKLKSLPLEEE